MPKVSRDTASETVAFEGLDVRLEHLDGGYSVCFESHSATPTSGICSRPARGSLPAAPLGVRDGGRVTFRFDDREETYAAGDAYFVPPGHAPSPRGGGHRRVQPHRRTRPDDLRGHGEPEVMRRMLAGLPVTERRLDVNGIAT